MAAAFKLSSVAVPSHHSLSRLDGSGEDSSSVTGNETVVKNNVDNINGHHSRIISQTDDSQNKLTTTEHSDDHEHEQHIAEQNPIQIQRSSYDDTNDDNADSHSAKVSATIRNVLLLSAINDRTDNNTIEADDPATLTNLEMVQQTVRGHANNAHANTGANNSNLQSVIIQNAHSRLMHPSTSPLRYTTIETADTGAIMALEAAPSSPLQYSTLHTIVQNNNNNYLTNNNAHNYGDWNYGLSLDLRQKHSDDDKDRQHSHHHMDQQHYHHQQPQHNHHHHQHQHGVTHTGDNSGDMGHNASVVVIAGHDHHTHADLMDEAQTLITVAANHIHNHQFDDDGGVNGDIHHHAAKITVNDPHQTSISGETAVMRTGLMYTYGSAIATAPSNLSQHQTSSNGSANAANSTIDEVIADTLKDEMVEGTTPTPTTTTSEETNYLQLISHNHHHHTIRSQSSGGDSRSPSGLSQEDYENGMQTFANLSNAAHTTGQRDTIYSNSSVGDPSEHASIIHPISISYESPMHSTGGAGISTR